VALCAAGAFLKVPVSGYLGSGMGSGRELEPQSEVLWREGNRTVLGLSTWGLPLSELHL
jgi:hypothetical protein